jgi:uncharacterized protein (DUF2336 family)
MAVMTLMTTETLLAELDTRLPQASESWCGTVLRRIADLFVGSADTYNDQHVAVFDAVMGRLIPKTDRVALAELSGRLASVANAPINVLGNLAHHLDTAVCGPVLDQATALPDKDLVEIADRDRVDPSLLARIAARPRLSEAVTDVLLKRGDPALQRMVIDNQNARISEGGFARVIMGLGGDKDLAKAIAARSDVPAELRPWLT